MTSAAAEAAPVAPAVRLLHICIARSELRLGVVSVLSSPETCLQVWRAGTDAMQEGEALDYDPTAYDCLHQFTLDWPCLR